MYPSSEGRQSSASGECTWARKRQPGAGRTLDSCRRYCGPHGTGISARAVRRGDAGDGRSRPGVPRAVHRGTSHGPGIRSRSGRPDRPRLLPSDARHDFDPLLKTVEAGARKGFNTAGPGYLAYIPGGGLYAAALADFLACGVNRFVNVWHAAPRFAQIEQDVIAWLSELFAYPREARGILTSGGSMANFSAIVTARHALLGEDSVGGTLYVTEQAHASVAKAAVLAGFPQRAVRVVPTTADLAMDVERLIEILHEDRAQGLRPFCVVASAGTTNTGRVDPIGGLVQIAREQDLWLHVDGAYGGFFQLTDRGRRLFDGIADAHSITLDPHKGMFLPYGTGSLLVREGKLLRDAHHVGAEYLQDLAPEEEIPNFADYSPELSRDFRGLRVWLPLMLHGVGAF